MFDDPKKDLKWLEAQLLAEEQPQEEFSEEDDWFEDEEDWLDTELRQAHALLGDAPVQQHSREDIFAFLEEDIIRDDAQTVYTDAPVRAEPKKGKKKKKDKEKGVGGLVFLACLEALGIIAVLLWWLIWLL